MLATVNLEKERLQKQCKNLESTAEELRNQNQRLAADKEQLQAIAGAHEQEIRRLKSDNATLEKSVTKLKREIQSINKLKQSVQEQLADLKVSNTSKVLVTPAVSSLLYFASTSCVCRSLIKASRSLACDSSLVCRFVDC